jgi:alanyl-tRNA synthetase
MTERLYYQDSYTTSFAATVIDATTVGGKPALVLDRTFFYPTSGGQPNDTGLLAGQPVVDVIAQDGAVLHVMAAPPAAGVGARVEGAIDWTRRYDHMQQHSGQHLLSQVFARLFEYETVSVHFGADESTLDLEAAAVEPEQVVAAEREANRIAYTALSIMAYFVADAELSRVPVRRPPKVAGQIRIVEIAGFDYSACGGTHVRTTAEIAPLKVLRQERRKGLTRLTFKCGLRACADYATRAQLLSEAAQLFSNEVAAVPGLVRATLEQNRALQRQVDQLTEQVIAFEVDALLATAPAPAGRRVVAQLYSDRSVDALKVMAARLRAQPRTVALLATQAGGRLTLLFARSDDVNLHMGNVLRDALKACGGSGGGRPDYAQGGAPDPAVGEEVLRQAQTLLDGG